MASSKEMQQTARPLTHRPSISNAPNTAGALIPANSPGALAGRQPHARTVSHSIIGAALNANHRVGRRKSMTSPNTNAAVIAALIQEADTLPLSAAAASAAAAAAAATAAAGVRRNTVSSKLGAVGGMVGGMSEAPGSYSRAPTAMAAAMALANGTIGSIPLPSPPASLPSHKFVTVDGSAIDDELNDMSDGDEDSVMRNAAGSPLFDLSRMRRASDSQPLAKDGRRASNRIDLRCDKCGKGYKHSSCLTKHLWEHTPEWSYTSKLLISKHQQVQLLEAASVLVAMNNQHPDGSGVVTTPPESSQDFASERDSASPTASTYSDQNDDHSSADTTPPPHMDNAMNFDDAKREPSFAMSPPSSLPGDHAGFSQSYQSGLMNGPGAGRALSRSAVAGSAFSFGYQGQQRRSSLRPPSSGLNATGQEDNELAAAVELLSCSFNSGSGGDVHGLGQNVPPVPPLPAQYLGQASQPIDDTSFISSFPSRAPESFTRGERFHSETADDVAMGDSLDILTDDDEFDRQSRARSDDEDDGVFGRMEE